MTNETFISVIMPAYDVERFITKAIESVIAQDHMNWELIVVDDCSVDKTKEIIVRFASQDKRIVPVYNAVNSGRPSKAKNIALAIAKGEYIAFLDADDEWLPGKLSQQVHAMQQDGCDFSYTGGYIIDEEDQLLKTYVPTPKVGNLFPAMLWYYESLSQSVMIKNHRPLLFDEALRIGEDYNLFMNLLYTYKACAISIPLVKYRVRSTSITREKHVDLGEGVLFTLKELDKKYHILRHHPLAYLVSWTKAMRFRFVRSKRW